MPGLLPPDAGSTGTIPSLDEQSAEDVGRHIDGNIKGFGKRAETSLRDLPWAFSAFHTLSSKNPIPLPGLELTTPEILQTPESLSRLDFCVPDMDNQLLAPSTASLG